MAAGTQMGDKETDEVRDTEITLSTGKLLGIFFALAIVCGVFFTMGYLLGKSTSAGGRTEIVASVPTGSAASNSLRIAAGGVWPSSIDRIANSSFSKR